MTFYFFGALTLSLAAFHLLTACDQTENLNTTVITASGNTTSLIGTWETRCFHYDSVWDGRDKIIQQNFYKKGDSLILKRVILNFDSTNNSCTTATLSPNYTYDVSISSTTTSIAGWENSIAPFAQDQSGIRLSYTAEFTPLTGTLTHINDTPTSENTSSSGYIIDDTGPTEVMYKIQELGLFYGVTDNPYFKK